MQETEMITFAVGVLAGLGAALLAARGRFDELRKAIGEAREREKAAAARAATSDEQREAIAAELKTALEEKGKYQNEATRVEEAKSAVVRRDEQIVALNDRISGLEREKATALAEADAANKRADEMVANERETHQAILKTKDEQIEKLNEFIQSARSTLSLEFKALSGEALKEAREELGKAADTLIQKHGATTIADVELHRTQIEKMLKPVELTIQRLDQHVENSDKARTTAEALLDDQIKRLAGASESLTSALRKPAIRGSWGEMTLENALENAGLTAEIDFVLQHSTDAEDGRKRTDAIINLPKGRKLVIDSKNLMESYIPLAGAQDDGKRASLAQVHSKSLRNHIRDLSSKEYQNRYDTPDCVILFIPHDGMYHAALQDEADLIREACERRVFVTNPMSLIPLLKAVGYVLDQERANKSAEAIKKVGSELYGEITRFAASMATIGNRLDATVRAYNEAIPGLDRFIVAKSRTLKQLGAGRGDDPELPDAVEREARPFSSRELRTSNLFLRDEENGLEIAAGAEQPTTI